MAQGHDQLHTHFAFNTETAGNATDTATEYCSNDTAIILGSLLGPLLLIVIAAVIFWTFICICLRVHTSRRKREDTGKIATSIV